jgi:cyclin-dependent kinase 8/11
VIDRYKVIGFISSGTYGRVYKAVGRHGQSGEFAIKKFKPGIFQLSSPPTSPHMTD